MPLTNRYTGIIQGGITATGNNLCLNGSDSGAWTQHVYITTNTALQVPGYPRGTTTNYTLNSSRAYLNIPANSIIIYAALMWTGQTNSNVSARLSTPVQSNILVAPQINDVYAGFNLYWHSANISAYVQAGGAGYYTVGNIDGGTLPGDNGAAWTILVAYQNQSFKYRYININTGPSYVSGSPGTTYNLSNFATPSGGTVKGALLMSYTYGDFTDNSYLQVGRNSLSYVQIGNPGPTSSPWNGQAPYNPQGDMFPGIVCNADPEDSNFGFLDTRGTFGTRNVSVYGTQNYGRYSRTLYDLAGFDISKALTINQNSLSINVWFNSGGGAVITSESVQIDINSANVVPSKLVDKATAVPNEVLTYTIVLKNIGLLDANNVIVVDTLPAGTSFINGTLKKDGVTVPGSPVPPGYTIATLPLTTTTTLTFKATVDTIPGRPTSLNNSAYIAYSFTPITTPQKGTAVTNIVTTSIPAPTFIDTYKATNKAFADIGDYITYTFTIPNTGNLDAGNVIFMDTIPSCTTYVSNSFFQNGTLVPGGNPQTGVNLGTIAAGLVATVSFRVQVFTLPTVNPITNTGMVYYKSYGVTPMADTSNVVQTKVNHARVAMIKTSDVKYADIGTTITYTILLNNNGSVSAANVLFSDTIPNDTTFVSNSLKVNGITIAGSPNPPGVNIGTIPVGITTVSFKVTVNTMPTPNPIPNSSTTAFNYTVDPSIPNGGAGSSNSNTAYTQVNHGQIVSSKIVDKSYVTCEEILKYTVVIKNIGNVSASNIVFQDTTPNGTQFINNSFTVNGVTISGANPNTGVNISTIPAGATSTLTFQLVVIC